MNSKTAYVVDSIEHCLLFSPKQEYCAGPARLSDQLCGQDPARELLFPHGKVRSQMAFLSQLVYSRHYLNSSFVWELIIDFLRNLRPFFALEPSVHTPS